MFATVREHAGLAQADAAGLLSIDSTSVTFTGGEPFGQCLNRDITPQLCVVRAKDYPHAAFTKTRGNLVGPDF